MVDDAIRVLARRRLLVMGACLCSTTFRAPALDVVLWLSIVGRGDLHIASLGRNRPAFARYGGKVLAMVVPWVALAAAIQTVKTGGWIWSTRRRRLRLAVLAINVVIIEAVADADVADSPVAVPGAPGSLPTALSLFMVAMLAAWASQTCGGGTSVMPRRRSHPASGRRRRRSPIVPPRNGWSSIPGSPTIRSVAAPRPFDDGGADTGRKACDGALAARSDVPEQRLRQVINEGLGYRDWNAFLDRY